MPAFSRYLKTGPLVRLMVRPFAGSAVGPVTGIAACLTAIMSGQALSADLNFSSTFKITYLGLGIGQVKSSIKIVGNTYQISGSGKANKVISMVASAGGAFHSEGQIRGERVIPRKLMLKYKAKKKKGSMKMTFLRGDLQKAEIKPFKKLKKDAVPVLPAHLQSVVDPVSSLMFPVRSRDIGNGKKICNRTIPVFDGRTRMNLVFSYQSEERRQTEGFDGNTFTCTVRYRPVSGHRPHKKNVKFMQSNEDMKVILARMGNSNVYGLFAFRLMTDKGPAGGYATRFASH